MPRTCCATRMRVFGRRPHRRTKNSGESRRPTWACAATAKPRDQVHRQGGWRTAASPSGHPERAALIRMFPYAAHRPAIDNPPTPSGGGPTKAEGPRTIHERDLDRQPHENPSERDLRHRQDTVSTSAYPAKAATHSRGVRTTKNTNVIAATNFDWADSRWVSDAASTKPRCRAGVAQCRRSRIR